MKKRLFVEKTRSEILKIGLSSVFLIMSIFLIGSYSINPSTTVILRSFESRTLPVAHNFASIEFKEDISSCYVGFHNSNPINKSRLSNTQVSVHSLTFSTSEIRYLPEGSNVSIHWYSANKNITCSVSPDHESALNITNNTSSETHTYLNFEIFEAGQYRVTFNNPTTIPLNFTYFILWEYFIPFSDTDMNILPMIGPGWIIYDSELEQWVDPEYIPPTPLSLKEYSFVTLTNIYHDPIEVKYRLKGTKVGDKYFNGSTLAALIIFPIVGWVASKIEDRI